MKFSKRSGPDLVFEISKREKRMLFDLLKLYPLIPATHHQVSHSIDPEEFGEDHKLLEEALAEQRKENRRKVEAMLQEKDRFQETKTGWRLTLAPAQTEWLLQVLNDVRVGSWLILGEPDEKKGKFIQLREESAPYLWAMELAGLFQTVLLAALSGPDES